MGHGMKHRAAGSVLVASLLLATTALAGTTDDAMRALRQQITFAAPTAGRGLIYGEYGTGKELVARSLHSRSLRSSRAFIEVNCAAIPEDFSE